MKCIIVTDLLGNVSNLDNMDSIEKKVYSKLFSSTISGVVIIDEDTLKKHQEPLIKERYPVIVRREDDPCKVVEFVLAHTGFKDTDVTLIGNNLSLIKKLKDYIKKYTVAKALTTNDKSFSCFDILGLDKKVSMVHSIAYDDYFLREYDVY